MGDSESIASLSERSTESIFASLSEDEFIAKDDMNLFATPPKRHCAARKELAVGDEPPNAPEGNRAKRSRGKSGKSLAKLFASAEPTVLFFEDRKALPNAPCMACRLRSEHTYQGCYHLCCGCAMLTVGIPLSHPKLILIIELRREVDELRKQVTEIEKEPNSLRAVEHIELGRRQAEIDKVLHRLLTL
jgi:hypothetical protein